MRKIGTPGLNTTFAGIEFRSPIGVGAIGKPWGKNVTPSEHAEILLKHVDSGAGYICIPTCWYSTAETREKLQKTARREHRSTPVSPKQMRAMKIQTPVSPYGLEGMFLIISPFWNDLAWAEQASAHSEELTKILAEKKPDDVRLIANVGGLSSLPETYVDGALKWQELGADLIEINVSCGFPPTMTGAVEDFMEKRFPPRFQGALLGDHSDIVEEITKKVVQAVNIPVGVKLSPETGFPRVVELAQRIKDAGAKWINVVNVAVGIAPPDIYNQGRPLWPFADGNPFVTASGSWLRVKCYMDVAAIGKFVPGIDIAAAGGLVIPEHVVEVMMLGARLTQLCTGVIERGRKLIRLCDAFIKKFMVEQGYQTVEEIIGLGQQYIKYNEDVDLMAGQIVAKTDELKCNRCGACVDNICIARYWENGMVRTKESKCSGCGGCIIACPNNAIKLVNLSVA
jgi:dihydropyrimidine dehydrogenase (NAD+) subunit PreA